ncbi:hypothetical protein Bbelb_078220 [Branchiostoma belcheri]|nr:hypothetical protein Bbelb_078220 [Branchiostoma belcheri]
MSGGQQQSQTGDTEGATPTQQPQTDWQSVADAAANIPNTLYVSRSDAYDTPSDGNKCWRLRNNIRKITGLVFAVVIVILLSFFSVKDANQSAEMAKQLEEIKKQNQKTELRVAELEGMCISSGKPGKPGPPGPPGEKGATGPAHLEKRGPRGLLALGLPGLLEKREPWGLLEERGPRGLLALGLSGLLEKREPWGLLEERGPRGLLALGLPGLLEKRGPRGLLALGLPGLLEKKGPWGLLEKRGPWGLLALGLPGLLEKRGPWGLLVLGLPGLLALVEKRGPGGQLALGIRTLGFKDHPDARDKRAKSDQGGFRGCGGPQGFKGHPDRRVQSDQLGHKGRASQLEDFFGARATCRHDGGVLAMPRDAETNAFLKSLFQQATGSLEAFWLGIFGRRNERGFKWADGTVLGPYTAWAPKEPRKRETEEACVLYQPIGTWNDGLTRRHGRALTAAVLR